MNYLCAVDSFFYDYPGGVARVALDIAGLMRDSGHNVTILCRKGNAEKKVPPVTEYEGIRVLRCNNSKIFCLPRGITWIDSTKKHVKKFLAGEVFDLVHIHSLYTGKGVMNALGDSTQYVYTIHSPVVLEQRLNWQHQGLKGKAKLLLAMNYFKKLENDMIKSVSAVHVLSKFTETKIKLFHNISKKLNVIPHWPKPKYARKMTKEKARQILNWPENPPILFTVRNHIARTGIDIAIEALAPLAAQGKCFFVIAGDGPLRKKYQQQALDKGADTSQVLFTGHLSDEQLALAYQAADLFILPTIDLECFGLIILESLASGCPVLGTDVGAIPELLGSVSPDFMVPPNNAQKLREKALDILNNKINIPDTKKLIEFVKSNHTREINGAKIRDLLTKTGCS